MLKLRLGIVLGVAMLACATGARADQTQFDLTATGPGTNVNLVLTGTSTGTPGLYDVTSISGTVDGLAATILNTSAPGVTTDTITVNGWYIYFDNLLNMNQPYFDLAGLGFELSNGALGNLYYSGGYWYTELGNNPPYLEAVSISVVTPEPGTLLLLGAGMLAIGILLWRSK
jgi:hypothetical protein